MRESRPGTQLSSGVIIAEALNSYDVAAFPIDYKLRCLLGLSPDALIDGDAERSILSSREQ